MSINQSNNSADSAGSADSADKADEADEAEEGSKKAFAERSSLYQEFLAERDEILKHKWIESEKRGEDIGFERALLDWIRKHRGGWRNDRKAQVNGQK